MLRDKVATLARNERMGVVRRDSVLSWIPYSMTTGWSPVICRMTTSF